MKRLLVMAGLLAGLVLPQAAHAQALKPLVDRLTRAWMQADASAIASFAAKDGVTLDIGSSRVGPVPARQAAAALRKLFESRENVADRAGMARPVGGSADRAFVEITWTTRARGTTVPERSTVYFGLALEGDRWRVTEIRHIR